MRHGKGLDVGSRRLASVTKCHVPGTLAGLIRLPKSGARSPCGVLLSPFFVFLTFITPSIIQAARNKRFGRCLQ